jgi:hypothetical protein
MSRYRAKQPPPAIMQALASQRYADALRLANEEVRRNPGDHHLLNLCADIYMLLRKEDTAARVLRHVADVHAANGAPAKAVVALKKIERIGRDDPTMYESVAKSIENERNDGAPIEFTPLELSPEELNVDSTKTIAGEIPLPFLDDNQRAVDERDIIEGTVPSPLFDDFSRDELLAFIRGLQLQLFDPGDIIVAEGDAGDSLFILTSGIVKAFVRDRGLQYRRVRTLHDGDFFGEISVLTGGRRSATLTAATHCELLELDRPTLDKICTAHPRVREVMQRFYDERVASDRTL